MFFQTLWFMIKTAALLAAGAWLALRPGFINLSVLEYDVRVQTGAALVTIYLSLLLLLFLHRLYIALSDIPKAWRRYHDRKNHQKGLQAISLGLSAAAAGDSKIASYQAYRARALLPDDKGMTLFLAAQAARLRGDTDAARDNFQKLVDQRDTSFLGLRGLMLTAMEEGNTEKALMLSREALALHPKQPWVLMLVYQLTLRTRQWAEAERILARAQKIKAVEEGRARSDLMALYLQQSDEAHHRGEPQAALRFARKAHSLDPGFVPAAARLVRLYSDDNQKRAAIKAIESCWRLHPHPELVPLWDSLMPEKKSQDNGARLRWYERLVALRPDGVESQIAAARVAIEEGLWGEARQYLAMAEKLQPNARVYRLWARLAERQHQPEESRHWLEKAADARPDKVWVCRETGRLYDRWSAIAEPHGAFNTIIWDDAHVVAGAGSTLLAENPLLIDAPLRAVAR